MKRLDKASSRQRWKELRDKWNEYDSSVVIDGPKPPHDEYVAHVGPTMRPLDYGAKTEEVMLYLDEVSAYMDLTLAA